MDKAFRLIDGDDRRKLSEQDEHAAKILWRRAFRDIPEKELLGAVGDWLQENKLGRPNTGKLKEFIARRRSPVAEEREIARPLCNTDCSSVADERLLVAWAISVLRTRWKFQEENYRHTIEGAERVLARRGWATWQDAKSWLTPGWSQTEVSEVKL